MAEKDMNVTTGSAAADTDKYRPFTADYEDFDGMDQRITLRFRRPGRKELTVIAKVEKAKQFDTMCNTLRQIVHPDEKDRITEIIRDEPMLAMSFADAVFKKCGAGVVEPGN